MKRNMITLFILLVTLSSCHKWVFTTKSCSSTTIPPYSNAAPQQATPQQAAPQQAAPQQAAPQQAAPQQAAQQGTWSDFEKILKGVYKGRLRKVKIIEGNRHLLVIKSKKKHEEDIRQLICDYWKE